MAGPEISAAQRRFIDAAIDAFAENGFGGTSTRDIAERAGRSQASVYVHYESKEALFYEISLRGHLDSLACLRDAHDANADPAARLHAMVLDFSWWHIENAKTGRVIQYQLHALSPEHFTEITELRREFHALMLSAVSAGIEAALFQVDDLEGTTRALLSLCIDPVRWFDPKLSREPRSIARLNADLALRVVGLSPSYRIEESR